MSAKPEFGPWHRTTTTPLPMSGTRTIPAWWRDDRVSIPPPPDGWRWPLAHERVSPPPSPDTVVTRKEIAP